MRKNERNVESNAAYFSLEDVSEDSDNFRGESPNPLRIRNILTLEERVAAIKAYNANPMYTKVARMFNCSWEQIKNIIANQEGILAYYETNKRDQIECSIHGSKLKFLAECLYEYIQRGQYHSKLNITEDLIRVKALQFNHFIKIENFSPTKGWINHFKTNFNFCLSNRQNVLTRVPPSSLDLKDIINYCSKAKQQTYKGETLINSHDKIPKTNRIEPSRPPSSWANQHNVTKDIDQQDLKDDLETSENISSGLAKMMLQKFEQQQKLDFLGECLYEYLQRAQYHMKVDINEDLIRIKALELNQIINVDHFIAHKGWLNHFKVRYNFFSSNRHLNLTHIPPSSLNFMSIISFCLKRGSSAPKTSNSESPRPLHRWTTEQKTMIANKVAAAELIQRRSRKINFLEQALLEYAKRAGLSNKDSLSDQNLLKTAKELCDLLKFENFEPHQMWLNELKSLHNFDKFKETKGNGKKVIGLPLDLKDIISFCSRHNSLQTASHHVNLEPKDSHADDDTIPPFKKIKLTAKPEEQKHQDNVANMINDEPILILEDSEDSSGRPAEKMIVKHNYDKRDEANAIGNISIEAVVAHQRNHNASKNDPDYSSLSKTSESRVMDELPHVLNEKAINQKKLLITKIVPAAPSSLTVATTSVTLSSPKETVTPIKLPANLSYLKTNQDALLLLKSLEEYASGQQNLQAIDLITQLGQAFRSPEKEKL